MTDTHELKAGLERMTRKIAVVGSGYMGGGIAQVLALAGARVALADVSAEIAQRTTSACSSESDEFVADGLFPDRRHRHPEDQPLGRQGHRGSRRGG